MRQPRCHVTLKLATSLDGRIALASGESRWITGAPAREEVHRLRASVDAVGVGRGTVLADDPALTVRIDGQPAGHQPYRVVFAAGGAVPLASQLVATARTVSTIVVHGPLAHPDVCAALAQAGVKLVTCGLGPDGHLDLQDALERLANQCAIGRLLVEGGAHLATSLLRAGLVDRLVWVRAPVVLGADSRPAIEALNLAHLANAPRLKRVAVRLVGDDIWEDYTAAEG